ncbi:MAG: PadR family transcriptional regulator [Clostridia bacterium]|nr:PadR family transcriptional regulator [Clostridia bacterium]
MHIETDNELVDLCVLSMLKRENTYAYNIFKYVSSCVNLTETSLYCILKHLEEKNLLSSYPLEYNNRLRKYYAITAQGIEYVTEFLNKWKSLANVYNFMAQDKLEKKRRWL